MKAQQTTGKIGSFVRQAARNFYTPIPKLATRKPKSTGRAQLVLASGSPRRLALLEQAGIEPDALRPPSIDETAKKGEMPRTLVNRLAMEKANAARKLVRVDEKLEDAYILAADTIVATGRRVFTKPETMEEAGVSLKKLSGRVHKVYTSVVLITPENSVRRQLVETRVRFKRLSRQEIDSYLASGEWRGKAGGYAIQGLAGSFVLTLNGSYTNVVGLPLAQVVSMLYGEGYPVYFNWLSRAELQYS